MVSLAYEILQKEVDKAGWGGIGKVAQNLGYGRSSINLYLRGKYPAGTEKLEEKILATYSDSIVCPFTKGVLSKKQCDDASGSSINASNPVIFKLQQFCKSCPVRNQTKDEFKKQFRRKR